MEKVVWLVWRAADAEPAALEPWLLDALGERRRPDARHPAHGRGPGRVVDARGAARRRLVAGRLGVGVARPPSTTVSRSTAALAGAPATAVHAYLVAESVPLDYGERRTWPDGERRRGSRSPPCSTSAPTSTTTASTASGTASTRRCRSRSTRSGRTSATPCSAAHARRAAAPLDRLRVGPRARRHVRPPPVLPQRRRQEAARRAASTRSTPTSASFADVDTLQTTPAREWILKTPPWGQA